MTPKQARSTLGMTQDAMAKAIGVGKSLWEKWEYQKQEPNAAARQKIEDMLWMHEDGVLDRYLAHRGIEKRKRNRF